MLGKLKAMLGSSASKPSRRRVSLEKRFTILSQSSYGTMSKVYKAADSETGRTVALKVQIKEKNEKAASRTSGAERPSEGEIGLRIVHPHVARTYECGETTKGEHYIVMEYIDGMSLQDARASTELGLRGRVKLLVQAAEGLAAVHAAGYIHHDINPRNYMVDRSNKVKLIDFGLAVPNTPAFHKPGNRTGALPYMAPELIRREATDERIDIFAFGALAFEFLTGKLPYEGTGSMAMMLQRINQDPADPALINPRISSRLRDLLLKTLTRRKEDRWPSMSTFAKALAEVPVLREAGTSSNVPEPTDVPR